MRLRDLDARFLGQVDGKGATMQDGIDGAQAVMFQCPRCAETLERGEEGGRRFVKGAHYVRVCFANPINAPVAPAEYDNNPRWAMRGTSLDDLTLTPSVNLDVPQPDGSPSSCTWHGFVTNGDAT